MEEAMVVSGTLTYFRNGDDDTFLPSFTRLPASRINPQFCAHDVWISPYPLDETLCNECTFLYHDHLRNGDMRFISALRSNEETVYLPVFIPDDSGEMIAIALFAAPTLSSIEENCLPGEAILTFPSSHSKAVFALPTTRWFPSEHPGMQLDARLSISISPVSSSSTSS